MIPVPLSGKQISGLVRNPEQILEIFARIRLQILSTGREQPGFKAQGSGCVDGTPNPKPSTLNLFNQPAGQINHPVLKGPCAYSDESRLHSQGSKYLG